MSGPRFSIVIPTRNRGGLLRHALATAVAIENHDLEIVVSDNCSTDVTAEVVAGLSDGRVRYVRSDTPLNNADSWEFAVSHARGEWITVLGDDDGFVPTLLDRVRPLIEAGDADVVGWGTTFYVHPDTDPPWPVEAERNRLSIHAFTGNAFEIDAEDQLARLFQRREIDPIPGVRDCFARRSLLDRVAERGGRLFGVPDPHWSLAAAVLTCIPSYRALDLPLSVTGCSPMNIGGGLQRNTRGHDVVREFEADTPLTLVLLRSHTCVNVVAESLERAKVRLPDLRRFEIDPARYLVANHEELTHPWRARDDGAELREWKTVLRSQPRDVRRVVRRSLARQATIAAARRLVEPLRRARSTGFRLVDGRTAGFTDLASAVRCLEGAYPPISPRGRARGNPPRSSRTAPSHP